MPLDFARRAYEHADTPLFVVAVEGRRSFRFVHINRAFMDATGLKRGQVVGRPVQEVIPEPSATMVLKNYRLAVRTRKVVRWEETSTYPTGEKHGEVAVTPVVDDSGRVPLLAGMVHDVTARKLAQRQARESAEMFAKAFHDNPTAMGIHRERDGVIVAVNRSFERLFGYGSDELVSKKVGSIGLFPRGFHKSRLGELSKRKNAARGLELEMRGRDRVVKNILVGADRISIKGEPCFLATFVDISHQKKAEKLLQQLSRSSQSRSRQMEAMAAAFVATERRERRRLAGIMHEDLQQQLVAASMQLKLLAKTYPREALPESLRVAQDVLADSLATARSLCHEIHPPTPLQAGFDGALRWLEAQMRRMYGLEIELRVPASMPRFPESTQSFLFGAVRELLFNCVKHAGASRAKVVIRRTGAMMTILVCDDGIGFDPASSESDPAGMGLISIRESLNALKGRLELDAAPNRGCRARILVPLPAKS